MPYRGIVLEGTIFYNIANDFSFRQEWEET
jgi:hypothetical protein